jgi:hypothetical protein
LLISTVALSPTALTIALARVLNAPHCLQASIVTIFLPPAEALVVGAGLFFFDLATGVVVVVGAFFLTTVDLALTGAASSFLVTAAPLRVPAMMMGVADYCHDDDGCDAEQILVARKHQTAR